MEKLILRKRVLEKLSAMNDEEYYLKSRRVRENLMEDPTFMNAETIGMTISSFPEVDTIELIEACWEMGKKVAVPKCIPATKEMNFYIIDNFDQLETVYMKLKEPIPGETERAHAGEIDLMIVPGVVYSPDGYRIGFGGGYFDRYLTGYSGKTRSLAFLDQIIETVPVESHDIPVEGIHTEEYYIDTKQVKA